MNPFCTHLVSTERMHTRTQTQWVRAVMRANSKQVPRLWLLLLLPPSQRSNEEEEKNWQKKKGEKKGSRYRELEHVHTHRAGLIRIYDEKSFFVLFSLKRRTHSIDDQREGEKMKERGRERDVLRCLWTRFSDKPFCWPDLILTALILPVKKISATVGENEKH